MAKVSITLPLPPSVNHYYRHVGGRVLISRGGREYRQAVAALLAAGKRVRPMTGRIALSVVLRPPDNRRRDLDNVWKALADSLTGWVYLDDGQIDDLRIVRGAVLRGGAVEVEAYEIGGAG